MLIASFYIHRNIHKETMQDIFGQKYIDGSEDNESSNTADLTCATGGNRTPLPSKCFGWQGSILSVNLDTLSKEQSVDCSICLDKERCRSLVYSTSLGENGD